MGKDDKHMGAFKGEEKRDFEDIDSGSSDVLEPEGAQTINGHQENDNLEEERNIWSNYNELDKEGPNFKNEFYRKNVTSKESYNKEKIKENENIKCKKDGKNKILFRVIWFVFLSLVSILLAGYALTAMNDMLGLGQSDNVIVIDIPEGANVNTVANILKEKGIITQKFFFKIYCILTKNSKSFLGGTYELKPNMDYQVLINKMKSHASNKDIVEVAFKEGMNLQEYAELLEENGVCKRNEFLEKCKSDEFDEKYEFLKEIKNKESRPYKLEGYLFPDTYEFYKNEDPSGVIRRFLNNFQKKIIKISSHEGYDKKTSIKYLCEEKGKTLDEIINISSMIQAEAANKSDMYKVSSVIYNRLAIVPSEGINKFGEYGLSRLGIDSTVWYPYRTKNDVPSDIIENFNSPYDTYNIEGLPPGPICNPGLQAFYAALKPEKTEYFYFCHSVSGEAYYAKNKSEHEINLRKAGLA